jgi:UDP-N-acetylmuramoyl-tripeptide--D-alanyl-D-alanine ligase
LARPDVAVITRIAPVHLEFFESVEAIAQAKAEVFAGLGANGVAVLNPDDPYLRPIGAARRGPVAWFGRDRACLVSAENWRGTAHGMRFDLRVGGRSVDVALSLPGPHNVQNFLAAATVAHVLGVSAESIAAAALRVRAASHRGEVRRLAESVTLYDDCYNASPLAVDAAVTALAMTAHARRVAVLGEMRELGETAPDLHLETGRSLHGRVDVVLGVGPLARHVLDGARQAGLASEALHFFDDAASAAAAVGDLVRPGDAVLVKGSRGVQLEAVVAALLGRFAPLPEQP